MKDRHACGGRVIRAVVEDLAPPRKRVYRNPFSHCQLAPSILADFIQVFTPVGGYEIAWHHFCPVVAALGSSR